MKAKFKIYPESKLIVVRFTGTTVYEDILRWFNEAHEHPDFSPEYPGLVDLRKAVFGLENREDPLKMVENARALAAFEKKIDFTSARWAILADAPMETSLMMVYSKEASQKHAIEIFSTVEAAEDYLGISLANALQDLST